MGSTKTTTYKFIYDSSWFISLILQSFVKFSSVNYLNNGLNYFITLENNSSHWKCLMESLYQVLGDFLS